VLGQVAALQAYKLRGPLTIDAVTIRQARNVVPLQGATVEPYGGNDRITMVRVTPAPAMSAKMSSYTIDPFAYGLDVNTLASTLTQMVRWLDEGRTATPAEIAAMLTVQTPKGVPVGDSVDIALSPTVSAPGKGLG
jgi:hypothetical protein